MAKGVATSPISAPACYDSFDKMLLNGTWRHGKSRGARATTSTSGWPSNSTRWLHFDERRAVEPLERAVTKTSEVPQTYPFEV